MILDDSLLLCLMRLIDRIPMPALAASRRGRPPTYSDRLVLKALAVMVLKRLPTVHALLAVLDRPTPEMHRLRAELTEQGRFPARRTWERRLGVVPERLPAQIACLGNWLLRVLAPVADDGRAVAVDSTPLHARGGVWHQRHRAAGGVPHTSIDTEAHWTQSGWHGWVYGWKLHLVVTAAGVWLPLRAALTPANVADNVQAVTLVADLPAEARFVLADGTYDDHALRDRLAAAGRILVTPKGAPYPHTDAGAGVRKVLHEVRSRASENVNGQFKAIFDVTDAVPTRGERATTRWLLGAVLVYQLTLLLRHEQGLTLRTGLKPFLQAARPFVTRRQLIPLGELLDSTDPLLVALRSALKGWADGLNLSDDWILAVALATLGRWLNPIKTRDRFFDVRSIFDAQAADAAPQVDDFQIRITIEDRWAPGSERTRNDVLEQCTRRFRENLLARLDGIEASVVATGWASEPSKHGCHYQDQYRWLALRVVEGRTYEEIAQDRPMSKKRTGSRAVVLKAKGSSPARAGHARERPTTSSAVHLAVKRAADLIGLTLPATLPVHKSVALRS